MSKKKLLIYLTIFVLLVLGNLIIHYGGKRAIKRRTVADAIEQIRPHVEGAWKRRFKEKNIEYPPSHLLFVAYKQEKDFQVWAKSQGKYWLVRNYGIKKASGQLGPKLLKGDRQVPEGLYQIIGLNPNSSYHLSLKLDYPNGFDKEVGLKEGRGDLGDDIFIHGKSASAGCLAMGDEPIEEIFFLTSEVGKENVEVVIAPNKKIAVNSLGKYPSWIGDLYGQISELLIKRGVKEI